MSEYGVQVQPPTREDKLAHARNRALEYAEMIESVDFEVSSIALERANMWARVALALKD